MVVSAAVGRQRDPRPIATCERLDRDMELKRATISPGEPKRFVAGEVEEQHGVGLGRVALDTGDLAADPMLGFGRVTVVGHAPVALMPIGDGVGVVRQEH